MAKLFSSVTERIAIRGMCSRDPKIAGGLLAALDESHFNTDEAKSGLAAILKYQNRKGATPAFKVLIEDLRLDPDTREFLREDTSVPKTTADVTQVVERLNQYRHTRIFYRLCKDGLAALQGKTVDTDELTLMTQKGLAEMQTNKDIDTQMFHIGESGNSDDLVSEILYGEETDQWIPTGWKTWDNPNGGLPRGGLVIIGGSSGAGKSHVTLQLAKAQALLGYKVVIVPLEMTEKEQYVRLLANVSQTDSLKISLKKLAEEEKDAIWRRYRKFQKAVAAKGGRLTVYRPTSDVSIEETMAAVHSYNPDIIYIDYIGLLKGADGDDQWRQLGKIARYGKVYAGNHNKVVVLAAQVDQEGKIRYSQTIKEHASVGWTFVATKESREAGVLYFDTIKARNQQLLNFPLKVSYPTSTITDLSPEEVDKMEGAPSSPGTAPKRRKEGDSKKDSFMPDLD